MFVFEQKTVYEMLRSSVGADMDIRDSRRPGQLEGGEGEGSSCSVQVKNFIPLDYDIVMGGCEDTGARPSGDQNPTILS